MKSTPLSPIPQVLLHIGEELRTQDNRATEDPLFLVRGRRRIYGLTSDRGDGIAWLDSGHDYEVLPSPTGNPDMIAAYADNDDYELVGYVDVWETVTACLTEVGCRDFIKIDGRNYEHYEELEVYATSLRRNREMIELRDYLKTLPEM